MGDCRNCWNLFCMKWFYRNIVKFNFLRRDGIRVQQTRIQSVLGDPTAVYISMRWSPVDSDIGKHIVCANAEDSSGYRYILHDKFMSVWPCMFVEISYLIENNFWICPLFDFRISTVEMHCFKITVKGEIKRNNLTKIAIVKQNH